MELGQTQRPRAPTEPFHDFEPRQKCTVCCGLRSASVTGCACLCFSLLCNAFVLGGRVTDGRGWRGFVNRNGLLAFPVAAITFTHQTLLSESLWSKNKKTVAQVNVQSTLSNMTLWVTGVTVCTVLSRRYLPSRSRTYRLALWEYQRTRRGCANAYLPSLFGRVSEDLDWYNILWTLSGYHVLWGMVSVMLEKELGAHYAMFYRDSWYSLWCSPRWREWRELEVRRLVDKEQTVAPNRWGTFLSNDKWRTRNF
ncbi:hypothetical protein NESM_000498600 [Novymonas esmeraldas]|uniref:Uncharacterized protein n=1 Tax=Novymonas esmeraldas TaxID=1808958 RepID=A0AAW0ENH1_9TRYP